MHDFRACGQGQQVDFNFWIGAFEGAYNGHREYEIADKIKANHQDAPWMGAQRRQWAMFPAQSS